MLLFISTNRPPKKAFLMRLLNLARLIEMHTFQGFTLLLINFLFNIFEEFLEIKKF